MAESSSSSHDLLSKNDETALTNDIAEKTDGLKLNDIDEDIIKDGRIMSLGEGDNIALFESHEVDETLKIKVTTQSKAIFQKDKIIEKELHITKEDLSLCCAQKQDELKLPWCLVLGARVKKCDKASQEQAPTKDLLVIIYSEQMGFKLRCQSLSMSVKSDEFTPISLAEKINSHCRSVPGRPKKLFVIVNPIGGAKTAVKTFQNIVAPLLVLSNIKSDMQLTKHSKHALELSENIDVTAYDGILVVGGDGLYQEVCQGLVRQTQRTNSVDLNDPEAVLVSPTIPIGIVPAGQNFLLYFLHNVKKYSTSMLKISQKDKLLKFSFILLF